MGHRGTLTDQGSSPWICTDPYWGGRPPPGAAGGVPATRQALLGDNPLLLLLLRVGVGSPSPLTCLALVPSPG